MPHLDCNHLAESHIIYDPYVPGFRAAVWCRCRKVKLCPPEPYNTFGDAAHAATVLLVGLEELARASSPG